MGGSYAAVEDHVGARERDATQHLRASSRRPRSRERLPGRRAHARAPRREHPSRGADRTRLASHSPRHDLGGRRRDLRSRSRIPRGPHRHRRLPLARLAATAVDRGRRPALRLPPRRSRGQRAPPPTAAARSPPSRCDGPDGHRPAGSRCRRPAGAGTVRQQHELGAQVPTPRFVFHLLSDNYISSWTTVTSPHPEARRSTAAMARESGPWGGEDDGHAGEEVDGTIDETRTDRPRCDASRHGSEDREQVRGGRQTAVGAGRGAQLADARGRVPGALARAGVDADRRARARGQDALGGARRQVPGAARGWTTADAPAAREVVARRAGP